jgi:amino acid adenylation domain-containing protein
VRTVWEVADARARSDPAAIAIRGERDLSYGDLIRCAGELAGQIQAAAAPGRFVVLEATTPLAAVTGILAAARARCPFVSVSADSPEARRAAMLADVEPALILREAEPGRLAVEQLASEPARLQRPDMTSVAYVMYTSGSTGRPKGVVVEHEALCARLDGLSRHPGFGAGESILAMTAFSFDPSLVELLLPVFTGGSFVVAPPEARLDPVIFGQVVREYEPSVIQATPSFYRLALACGWEGAANARLWSGGEVLTPSLARSLLPLCGQLWNLYGPTEGTIWASAARITTPESVHLGEPLPGLGLCLEGDDGELVTPARPLHPGEILVYGQNLARGYLHQPDLTARQFRDCRTPDGMMPCYRTGDRAQYGDDGTLRFLGRRDGQIKLRGHRIELGEIESVLEEHPAIGEAVAVVVGTEDPDTAQIVAWLVAPAEVTPREIRSWLSSRLPARMRPARISIVPALPRTVTGKVDRVSIANQVQVASK